MMSPDLLVVGAGPAGMSAAIVARRFGLVTMVIDDQPAPGGQIWRSVETAAARDTILGPTFSEGREVADQFRAAGGAYVTGAQLWRLDPDLRTYFTAAGQARVVTPKAVILATGAQERPTPFPGWTLPGVLTVGAGQILLKNAGQIPAGKLVIAGSGPLPLLYATQLLRAGGTIAGYLDTTPRGQWKQALRLLPGATRAWKDLAKGAAWWLRLHASASVHYYSGVHDLRALGEEQVRGVSFHTRDGSLETIETDTLLVHEGVIPSVHVPMSVGCSMRWDEAQECFAPQLDMWGESSISMLFVAGDGAGIAGAKAAVLRGRLAAIRVASRIGQLTAAEEDTSSRSTFAALQRELAIRPFLDALYRPRADVFAPADETLVCRCEEVQASQIRALAAHGAGPNQIKSATRAGMGPCQGRQCGYTVMRLLSAVQQRHPAEIGYLHIRSPLKPITLNELATMEENPQRASD
jgi:NADPH-dependent 2,4-dienoyl-CoA reductase/sulfur reductase-like enzyme